MRIKIMFCMLILLPLTVTASENHGSEIYHGISLDIDAIQTLENETFASWDLHGWIGGDNNKAVVKAEGDYSDDNVASAEYWFLYQRRASEFWDSHIGIVHESEPDNYSYMVIGAEGLAPYFLETHGYVFISEKSDISLRFATEREFLLTQQWMLIPEVEIDVFLQDVPELAQGAGVSNIELELQTRYEVTRQFSVYIALSYERSLGKTADIRKKMDEEIGELATKIGIGLLF